MKVKIFVARYVMEYTDEIPLSSAEIYNKDKQALIKELEKDCDESEIDIDPDEYEYGWMIQEVEIEV